MHKKTAALVIIVLTIIAYGSYAVYSYDHRSAGNLSAYCNIDFRGTAAPPANRVTGATLSVVDFHFGGERLEKYFALDIDGSRYEINAIETAAEMPTYSLQDFSSEKCFKHTNTLFIVFPPEILPEISQANTVKVSFRYVGSDAAIELPLSDVDLQYWKNQLKSR